MAILKTGKYKHVRRDGIVAIIIHKKKLLLLKRRNVPIILNPGIWSYLSGGRDGKEKYLETAYREIHEEVKLEKPKLKLLGTANTILIDPKKMLSWPNKVFFFRSSTDKVRLDFENSSYRWAPLSDILNERNYTNVFINEESILSKIKGFLNEPKRTKG